QRCGVIGRKASTATSPPLILISEIYKAQIRAAALYGAELWGSHRQMDTLQTKENNFLRHISRLGRGTPMLPLRLDLGL
ncbi:hypothetical protein NDU88_004359, partial [Pleurodeles waltl]